MSSLFARVAGRYDRLNRLLSLGLDGRWRRRAIERLGRLLGDRASGPFGILDIATGTADFALAAARRFPAARITGIDLTPEMLAIGERKVEAAGLTGRITLQEGDAAALPFAAGSFAAALCAFGFRNFPDRPASLAAAARILENGGRLVVLEFFRPRSALLGALTSGWLRCASAVFARGASGEYAYLRRSIERTCSAGEFVTLAREAGLDVEVSEHFLPACSCLILRKCGKL